MGPQRYRDQSWFVEAAEIMRTAYVAHKDDDDFVQPGTLYRTGGLYAAHIADSMGKVGAGVRYVRLGSRG